MERINTQPTFTDLTLAHLGGTRSSEFFDPCGRLIPFDKLAAAVSGIFVEHHFAAIKKMLPRKARYRTLRRNALDFGLCAMIQYWRKAMPRLNAA